MGQLEVLFRIGLAHPLMVAARVEKQIEITFHETGNTVQIDPPQSGPPTPQGPFGEFAQLVIHVKRECNDERGRDQTFANCRQLSIPTDAAKAIWFLFETIREYEYRGGSPGGFSTVPGYPVAPAEEIQDNPLVRTCSFEWLERYGQEGLIPHLLISA